VKWKGANKAMSNIEDVKTGACCSACATASSRDVDPGPVIACSLGTGFKKRAEQMEDLGRRALISSQRAPLRLQLVYTRDALDSVRKMLATESECCGFLDFDLQHNDERVELTITAPESAADIIDELFDSLVAASDWKMS